MLLFHQSHIIFDMIGAIAVTIRHIRIFLEVCRTMNVTRAAENLYMI